MYKKLLLISMLSICWGCSNINTSPSIQLDELTIPEIHTAYQEGTYTAEELVRAYIERIENNDSLITAISVINVDAIQQAQALDQEFEDTGVLRPLHGIPMLVKDNFNTESLPTTAGSLALVGFIPESNATMVQQLIDAGAIIIAKTNMAEWAFSPMHSHSSTIGITRNPYNTDHVPAGSSGGTGAAIAANFGVIGLGTDTGNSIRGPSSHNALVGFRSTLGLTSRYGVIPLYLRNDVAGPMMRTVHDATLVLNQIAGFDPKDPVTAYSNGKVEEDYTQFLKEDGLEGARIGVLRALSDSNTDPEIQALFEQALQDMKDAGAEIIDPFVIPNFDEVRRNQWCAMFKNDVELYLLEFVKDSSMQTIEDIIAVGTESDFAASRLQSSANANVQTSTEGVCSDPFTDKSRIAYRSAIESEMDRIKVDAIVYPSWNHKPALIDSFRVQYRGDNSQIIAPHTGQPAFTVPMGFTSSNLPAGLQILGRMFDEATLIEISYAYEQKTKHRKAPSLN